MHLSPDLSTLLEDLETLIVQTLLPDEAGVQFAHGKIGEKFLTPFCEELKKISLRYVGDGETTQKTPLTEYSAAAYALYYLPINFGKIASLLSHLPEDFFSRPLRILDIGAGPGTASLATLAHAHQEATLTLTDTSAPMLNIAKKLLLGRGVSPSTLTLHHSALPANSTTPWDLIVLGNMCNELSPAERENLIKILPRFMSEKSALLIVEPALFNSTRALMKLRDDILESDSSLEVLFPCTHRNPCPMLKREPKNWCHGTMHWDSPRLVQQLDTLTGFNKHRIKYSALLLTRGLSPVSPDLYRIITDPIKESRGVTATICGKVFYGAALLPKRNRTDENRLFQRSQSYDLLKIIGLNERGEFTDGSTAAMVEKE